MRNGYCLITPCRDEARYARRTLDSVIAQTAPPALWIIVDDGSQDETPSILAEYAARYDFIRIVSRADRGDRKLGGGVIDAFYAGYELVDANRFEFVCKLDLDLDLPPRYFELLMQRMRGNPRLGTCSGKPYYLGANGRPISEKCGDENSVGMTKFYRVQCFQEIDGFARMLMWDGIDCHRCRQLGWIAASFNDPELAFEHLRPMGTSHRNWWTGRVRHGVGQYLMGTTPPYMLASALYRMTRPPLVMGGVAMLWGYMRSMVQRTPRYGDRAFRQFVRRYQWACLLRGKRAATEAVEARQAAVWRRCHTPAGNHAAAIPHATGIPAFQEWFGSIIAGLRRRGHTRVSIMKQFQKVQMLGATLDAVSEEECIKTILNALDCQQGGWVATHNLDHVYHLNHDRHFAAACRTASLRVADGMPLVWASRLRGTPLPQRVTGSSLINTLTAAAAAAGRSVFLLGGNPGTAEAAAAILQARHPGLRIAGTSCPPPGFEQDPDCLRSVKIGLCLARPDIVFVALGSPKQEYLIQQLRQVRPQAWYLGVGISFSFVSGQIRRAPRWVQRCGLEWIHRLIQEPRRLAGRYFLRNMPTAARLLRAAIIERLAAAAQPAQRDIQPRRAVA